MQIIHRSWDADAITGPTGIDDKKNSKIGA